MVRAATVLRIRGNRRRLNHDSPKNNPPTRPHPGGSWRLSSQIPFPYFAISESDVFQTFQHESVATERSRCIRDIGAIPQIPQEERAKLRRVAETFPFHANTYYLRLIDWDDPRDPIRQLIIPQVGELTDWGDLDPSNESHVTVGRGLQHKYDDTALLLCSRVCGASCRYCFRKRLFLDDNDDVADDVTGGLAYIAKHVGVSDVLLEALIEEGENNG